MNKLLLKITGLAAAGVMLAACQSDSYKIDGVCDLVSNGDTIFITNDFASGKPFAHGIVKDGKFSVEGIIDSPTLCIAYSKSGANTPCLSTWYCRGNHQRQSLKEQGGGNSDEREVANHYGQHTSNRC